MLSSLTVKPLLISLFLSLSMLAALSYVSVQLYESKIKAEQSLKDSKETILALENSIVKKDLSCKIDDTSIVELEKEKKELSNQIDSLSTQISKLKSGIVSKSNISDKKEMLPKENDYVEKPNTLNGSELLSPDLKRLLKQGFCLVEPTDSYCTTRQPTSSPLQSNSSGRKPD